MTVAAYGIDEARLRRAFIEDAEELLECLNRSLLELEKNRDDPGLVNEVFRLTHSLKSESAMAGLPHLSSISHRLEDVFEKIRAGEIGLDQPLLDGILAGADVIAEMLNRIAGGGDDSGFDIRPVMEELSRLGGLQSAEPAAAGAERPPSLRAAAGLSGFERSQLREARDRGETLYRLVFGVADDEPMKYPRAYLVFNALEMKVNVIRTVPDLKNPLDDDRLYARVTILFTTDREAREWEKALEVDQVRRLELSTLPYESLLAEPAGGPPAASAPGSERTTIKVETRKLNQLWQLIGELIIHKSRLARLTERAGLEEGMRGDMAQLADAFDRIAAGMQQAMMETRMVPISVIFSRFPRLVRDLCRKLDKEADLEIVGEETEIDRSVIEVLPVPLTHLIRNCLDHGLEPPEERERLGKPRRGRVIISARTQGGKILIEISDDGRGLDLPGIRRKAGLPERVSDEEAVKLIFRPGFSTKENVTDLSGRGVGMDVVATRIRQELNGDILVRSGAGQGTTFSIVLPLVVNIASALVVRCRQHLYAVPVRSIGETVTVADGDLRGEPGSERLLYREAEIPLVRLADLVEGRPGRGEDGTTGDRPARGRDGADRFGVILEYRGRSVCLAVDEPVEEQELVIKPIDSILNNRGLFSGISLLGDGRIVYILDTTPIEGKMYGG